MKVIIIGGGAAGMMAALSAREHGADVCILERQARVGRKLLILRQLLFLLPLLWLLPRTLGAYGVWISMPIADSASILLAAVLFVWQMRKIRQMELLAR